MDDDQQYWMAARPSDVADAEVPDYLKAGVWTATPEQRHKLRTMAPGARIALKSTRTRRTGTSFFNADQTVSVMTVYATGTVESVDSEHGQVQVRWDGHRDPRDWYFFTYVAGLTRIAARHPEASQLIDFAFHGAEQDVTAILRKTQGWGGKYPLPTGLTWIPWYQEFASTLLQYRDDRGRLVDVITSLAHREPTLGSFLRDSFADGTVGPVRDVDPFTVFGTFNRWLRDEKRSRIVASLAEELGVTAALPQDFDGLPLVNNQRSWFISYARTRGTTDVDVLWRAFAEAISLADGNSSTDAFVAAFDDALRVHGVRWNLTMGLYWIRPNDYPTLDGPSRELIEKRFGVRSLPLNGEHYLSVREQLRERMTSSQTSITSFPLLSYAAWSAGRASTPGHDLGGFAAWATRIAESVDLDVEHDRKRAIADDLASVRTRIDSGDPTWSEGLLRAVERTKSLDFGLRGRLRSVVERDPARVAALFQTVWANPDVTSLDDLREGLAPVLGDVTSGNAAALGSWLLLALDPEANAPYNPAWLERWHRLTGTPVLPSAAEPSAQYRDQLVLLVALADTVEAQTGQRPSVLETQGMAWATTEHEIPQDWEQKEREALQTWRTEMGAAPRAWLVRARSSALDAWLDEGYVAIEASNLGRLPAGADKDAVAAAVESGYEHLDYPQRAARAAEVYSFLSRMRLGDLVAVPDGELFHIGHVDGDPRFVDGPVDRLRRGVRWEPSAIGGGEGEGSEGLDELAQLPGTVVDITQGLELLQELITGTAEDEAGLGDEGEVAPALPLSDTTVGFPEASETLALEASMPQPQLQEILDVLKDRRQIVFYGPPGTGKTYLAMKLAHHVVGATDRSRAQLVQFHPSYAYEDFFEGFRPRETAAGAATFKLSPGPLRLIAAAAEVNPGAPHVLVIDELNRANLARVFGELYFLLEYRKERIRLQYNPETFFRLPSNLYIIGTMNTADRSIALLDAAMRRRFAFIEMHPDEPPVRGVLRTWLSAHGASDERARLLDALNDRIAESDRDFKIGPSYLMRPEAETEVGLQRIWRFDILPLLEEHHYGRESPQQIRERFGLDALRASLAHADHGLQPESTEDADPSAG